MDIMLTTQQKAMMGDPESIQKVTDWGIMLRCPRCGAPGRYKVEMRTESGVTRGFRFRICCSNPNCTCATKLYDLSLELNSMGIVSTIDDERSKALLDWNTRPYILEMEDVKNGN